MRILSILGWACLVAWLVVLGVWAYGAATVTASQREAFLRERWELWEQKAAECERLCAKDRELAERAGDAWELLSGHWRLRERLWLYEADVITFWPSWAHLAMRSVGALWDGMISWRVDDRNFIVLGSGPRRALGGGRSDWR